MDVSNERKKEVSVLEGKRKETVYCINEEFKYMQLECNY